MNRAERKRITAETHAIYKLCVYQSNYQISIICLVILIAFGFCKLGALAWCLPSEKLLKALPNYEIYVFNEYNFCVSCFALVFVRRETTIHIHDCWAIAVFICSFYGVGDCWLHLKEKKFKSRSLIITNQTHKMTVTVRIWIRFKSSIDMSLLLDEFPINLQLPSNCT